MLLATRTSEAVDVLAGLLERGPGPDPVLFGGGIRPRAGPPAGRGARPADRRRGRRGYAQAWALVQAARSAVDRILDGLEPATGTGTVADVPVHAEVAPHWFDPGADLEAAAVRLERAEPGAGGWRWWGGEGRPAPVRHHAGASPVAALTRLGEAMDLTQVAPGRPVVVQTVAGSVWDDLASAEAVSAGGGHAARAQVRARIGPDHTRAVAALATALRAGRSQRRRHLREVDADWLTSALPLWVGTLRDIEELLPARGCSTS